MNKKIVLACVDCLSRNYTTESNKEAQAGRLELKKFCKVCNKHSIHRETK